MPEPEAPFTPTWDETKLARTKFSSFMTLYRQAKAQADQIMEDANDYKNQMAALQLKYDLPAVRVDDAVGRWIEAGKPGSKLVPEKVLEALGGNSKKYAGCFEETAARAAYYQVYLPKPKAS